MNDVLPGKHHEQFLAALSELKDTNFVAELFIAYPLQAADRVCTASTTVNKAKFNGAPWFERECRDKRSIAIKAGHRVDSYEWCPLREISRAIFACSVGT